MNWGCKLLVPLPSWWLPICVTKGQMSTENGMGPICPYPMYLLEALTLSPAPGGKCWSFPGPVLLLDQSLAEMQQWVSCEDLEEILWLENSPPSLPQQTNAS